LHISPILMLRADQMENIIPHLFLSSDFSYQKSWEVYFQPTFFLT
jgi:hypothetical protein